MPPTGLSETGNYMTRRGDIKDGPTALHRRLRISSWVAREVLPHEPAVRLWFARAKVAPEDIDEVIQEAYCRLAMLERTDHIDRADAYFFATCRNLWVRRLRRERLVPIATVAELAQLSPDMCPSPEREAVARVDYSRLMAMLEQLPHRCREIVRLRKIEGWSQQQIAAHFQISEKAVEKQIWLGVKSLREAWSDNVALAERKLLAFGRSRARGR